MISDIQFRRCRFLKVFTIYGHGCHLGHMTGSFKQTFVLSSQRGSTWKWFLIWTAWSEFGIYRLCEQRRFRRACASAQSGQNLRCSLIEAVSEEEPSDRKPDPWPLWMAGHAQLKCVMTECSKTQIRLTGLNWCLKMVKGNGWGLDKGLKWPLRVGHVYLHVLII